MFEPEFKRENHLNGHHSNTQTLLKLHHTDNTTQHSTTEHNRTQYNTGQHNTTQSQYNTTQQNGLIPRCTIAVAVL